MFSFLIKIIFFFYYCFLIFEILIFVSNHIYWTNKLIVSKALCIRWQLNRIKIEIIVFFFIIFFNWIAPYLFRVYGICVWNESKQNTNKSKQQIKRRSKKRKKKFNSVRLFFVVFMRSTAAAAVSKHTIHITHTFMWSNEK